MPNNAPPSSTTAPSNPHTPFWRRPGFFIAALVVVLLVIGLLVVTQYGESADEPLRINYADHSLSAYAGQVENLQDEKGPFYGMFARISSEILVQVFHGWKSIDGWHFMSFAAFVLGVYFFYRLCRRLVETAPAAAATLLFASQPLLWGHAFMNPKDNPFMDFFLASVCLGLEMVDRWQARSLESGEKLSLRGELGVLRRKLPGEWASAARRMRRLLTGLGGALAVLGLSFPLVERLIPGLVRQVYQAPSSSWVSRLFQRFAQQSGQVPVEAYIAKAQTQYGLLVFFLAICLLLAFIWTVLRVYPTLKDWSVQPRLLLAACFLGFVSDIRTLGPASGLLVAVYFLYRGGRKAIPYVLEYLAAGGAIIYAFWPYLWQNPLGGYLASLSTAADFPWIGNILFAGKVYAQGQQPVYYLPVLFSIQFTETALVLVLAGIALAVYYLVKRADLRMDMLLAGAWFAAPLAAAIVLHSTVYNNFRQFLFVVPPLFLFAGLALQAIWKRVKGRLFIYVPLVVLILLPGLYWDWQLQPYQYMYYNSLVGNVAGASQDYEMDYWFVTYKEGMDYVNQVAPQNSLVYFWLLDVTALPYARPDLKLTSASNPQDLTGKQTFYAFIPTHSVGSGFYYPDSKVVYEIRRGGALLAVVKQVDKRDLP